MNFYILQVLLSAFIGPFLVYNTLVYWVYPMKDYIGETGCCITFILRNAGVSFLQLQSLSMAIFRYICLFHSGSVQKLRISLDVSCKAQIFFLSQLEINDMIHEPTAKANTDVEYLFLTVQLYLFFRQWQS